VLFDVSCGLPWFGLVVCGLWGLVWCVVVQFCMVWRGLVWCGLGWCSLMCRGGRGVVCLRFGVVCIVCYAIM